MLIAAYKRKIQVIWRSQDFTNSELKKNLTSNKKQHFCSYMYNVEIMFIILRLNKL